MERLNGSDIMVICWFNQSLLVFPEGYIDDAHKEIRIGAKTIFTLGEEMEAFRKLIHTPGTWLTMIETAVSDGGSLPIRHLIALEEVSRLSAGEKEINIVGGVHQIEGHITKN